MSLLGEAWDEVTSKVGSLPLLNQMGLSSELFSNLFGGSLFGLGGAGDGPGEPDYAPLAEASRYAAELGRDLGREQLAETRRQYDLAMDVARPVSELQREMMREILSQGRDYYQYGQRGRDVEEAMRGIALEDTTARDEAERNLITGTDADIYAARRADIDRTANMAGADARQGLTRQYNQMLRQGMRYGYSPQQMAARLRSFGTEAGLGEASAVNQARQGALAGARSQLAQRRGLRMQDDATRFAKMGDVAGLYRNLPGISQGAYGLAGNLGTQASGVVAAPGAQLLSGMAQGAGMQQTGVGQQITGLGGVLNAQSGFRQAQLANQGDGGLGAMFGLAGATAPYWGPMVFGASDRRLKTNIVKIGDYPLDGTTIGVYEYDLFGARTIGVMADEVEAVRPEAVTTFGGYKLVNYAQL